MAPAAQPSPTPSPNTANAPGNVVLDRPAAGVVAAQRARAGRSETLALLEAGKLDGAKPSTSARAPAADVDPDQQPGGRSARADKEPSPDEDIEAETTDHETEDAKPEPDGAAADAKPDPETSKRLGQIQAAEKRHREKILADNRKLEERGKEIESRIESEWSPKIKAARDFDALLAKATKARSNPALLVDVIKALGYTDDHLEGAAQALYALSPKGQADPARRAHAERLLRDREEIDERSATQKRLDEMEQRLTSREQQSEFRELQSSYLDATVDAIPDTAPIAKAALAAVENARAAARAAATSTERVQALAKAKTLNTKFRTKLWELTEAMTRENDGDVPLHADVIARYEEIRGEELDELGIPRPTTATKKPNSQQAEKQNPAKTLSADLGAPRVPRSSQGGKEHRAETRRMLESGKIE